MNALNPVQATEPAASDVGEATAAAADVLRAFAARWRDRYRGMAVPPAAQRLITKLERSAAKLTLPDDAPLPEPTLDETTARFKLLVETVTDYAIFVLDPKGFVASWNPGAERIKGYRAEEIIGRHFSVFYTRGDVDIGKPLHELEIATRTGRYAEEGWRLRKDGTTFWASVTITALFDPKTRELRGFAKVTRDLTERRQDQELIRRSEERLRLMIESVKDYAIFMLDPDGKIATWNTGAERITAYRADEVLGRHFSMFYPPDDDAAGRPARELEIATSTGRYEEEGWRLRKSGERYWANVVLTAVRDPQTQALRGFAKVTRDLTERKRMEQEADLERSRALEAQSQLQARDEFISVAAHELRTPLTAVQLKVEGVLEGIKRNPASPKHAERLAAAVRQIGRLQELVERLLDVSRIVRGTLTLARAKTDLAALAREVAESLQETATAAGSLLTVEGPERLEGQWDHPRLEQVLLNLVTNAIKYGSGRPVGVRLEDLGGAVRVSVTDRGIGIAEADTERIFERFERAASLRHYAGLGLGLYVARSIVESHGGKLCVVSRLGDGSTFVIDLPKHEAALPSEHRR